MANWRDNKVLGIIAVVIFIVAIAVIVIVAQPKKAEVTLMSESTGEVMKMKVADGTEYPIVDPRNGKKDLYPAMPYRCGNGYEFYAILKKPELGKGAGGAMVQCPAECGGTMCQPVGTEGRKKLE